MISEKDRQGILDEGYRPYQVDKYVRGTNKKLDDLANVSVLDWDFERPGQLVLRDNRWLFCYIGVDHDNDVIVFLPPVTPGGRGYIPTQEIANFEYQRWLHAD